MKVDQIIFRLSDVAASAEGVKILCFLSDTFSDYGSLGLIPCSNQWIRTFQRNVDPSSSRWRQYVPPKYWLPIDETTGYYSNRMYSEVMWMWEVIMACPWCYEKYEPTNSMELSPPWEAASCAATQELPSILCNPKVHYHVHKNLLWARSIQSTPHHPILFL
jgi:hypothetical protein